MGSRLPGDGLSASEMAMYEYIQRRVRPAAELNIFAITVDGMQIAAMMNFMGRIVPYRGLRRAYGKHDWLGMGSDPGGKAARDCDWSTVVALVSTIRQLTPFLKHLVDMVGTECQGEVSELIV